MVTVAGFIYHASMLFLAVATAWQYVSGRIARACFALIGMGILLIVNEIRSNAKVVNCYTECNFLSPPPESARPDAPENNADDRAERR